MKKFISILFLLFTFVLASCEEPIEPTEEDLAELEKTALIEELINQFQEKAIKVDMVTVRAASTVVFLEGVSNIYDEAEEKIEFKMCSDYMEVTDQRSYNCVVYQVEEQGIAAYSFAKFGGELPVNKIYLEEFPSLSDLPIDLDMSSFSSAELGTNIQWSKELFLKIMIFIQ